MSDQEHNLPDDVVDFLYAHHAPGADALQPEDITVRRAAKVWRCGEESARNRLAKLVEEGKLVQVVRQASNGKQVYAYLVKKKNGK